MKRLWSIAALSLVLTGCGIFGPDDKGRNKGEEELEFVRFTPASPPAVQQASFWAVHGQARTLAIRYAGQPASEPPLLEFSVGALSLLTRPNGTPFLPGDSVQITVSVDPQGRFLFDFQPAGLAFSPAFPALLRMNYERANPDFNNDGVVNQQDVAVEQRLRIWRQQAPGLDFLQIPTIRIGGLDLLEGRVTHFTGFAMAD
jgi:hypothetical protein